MRYYGLNEKRCELTHAHGSIAELIKNISPRFLTEYSADPTNLSQVLVNMAIEYIEYVSKLNRLDGVEIARVEKIEAFYEKLADTLSPREYERVATQMRAFTNIKYQYRILPEQRPSHTVQ